MLLACLKVFADLGGNLTNGKSDTLPECKFDSLPDSLYNQCDTGQDMRVSDWQAMTV